ncbi:UNVERIFIED_CONTAM: hypothetical protein GTU68_038452 [Idotea baltica]|nr:hypothetical protein [Idotea baltica]
MEIREALTFDDVLLVPAASNVLPSTASTATNVTQSIQMNIPLLSSAMDTVTEARMAIAMAQAGGMGVVHRNLSIELQAQEVRRVKRFESGIVYNPITLHADQTLADAKALQERYRVTGFPDTEQAVLNPTACKDQLGRLRVAAASTVGDAGYERAQALVDAGADMIVIDTAHGHSEGVAHAVERAKKLSNEVQIVAGNVATAEATRALIGAGADAIKVGIGPGSICTTRMVAGVGVPQLTAIMDCASGAGDIPVIADGGIKFSGDFAKAIAAGASCAMVGSMIAGTDESPGEVILYQGRSLRAYRGNGSLGGLWRAVCGSVFPGDAASDKLGAEGSKGRCPYKGQCGRSHSPTQSGGPARGDGLSGCAYGGRDAQNCNFVSTVPDSRKALHDVQIPRESPNYRIRR